MKLPSQTFSGKLLVTHPENFSVSKYIHTMSLGSDADSELKNQAAKIVEAIQKLHTERIAKKLAESLRRFSLRKEGSSSKGNKNFFISI
jgi:hypothetical protein